jgi:hypothetical protein
MKPILKWLERKFSRHVDTVEAEEHHTAVRVRVTPKENAKEEYAVEVGYDQETATEPKLTILSDSSLDAAEPRD